MGHILQFTIDIDDEAIRSRVEEGAYKDIVNALGSSVYWRNLVDDAMRDFLSEHKDEIVAAVADKLHESMRRSRAVREAVEKAVEE